MKHNNNINTTADGIQYNNNNNITYGQNETCRVEPSRRRRRRDCSILHGDSSVFLWNSRGHYCDATTRSHPGCGLRIWTGLLKHLILLNSKKTLFFFHPYVRTCLHVCLFLSDAECENRERRTLQQTRSPPHHPSGPHICKVKTRRRRVQCIIVIILCRVGSVKWCRESGLQ